MTQPKVLGQANPAANTLTTLYMVPAGTSAAVSTITVCNTGVYATYTVAVRPGGAVLQKKHYVVFEAPIATNTTDTITLGIGLASGDVLTVSSSHGDMAFGAFGMEVT